MRTETELWEVLHYMPYFGACYKIIFKHTKTLFRMGLFRASQGWESDGAKKPPP